MKKSFRLLMLAALLCSSILLTAQDTSQNAPIQFRIGAAYTISPSFNIDAIWTVDAETSANFYSLFADLIINNSLIGRVQTSFLSSINDDLEDEISSGFEMNGSLGYNYQSKSNEKLSIPIMATLGFATVTDSRYRDAGMQIGMTTGVNYQLSNNLYASSSLRYLKGVEFRDGAKFDQIDISLGLQYRML